MSGNSAFEITKEDVWNVLMNRGIELSEDRIEEIFDGLDFDEIDNAALSEDDFDAQTDAAYEEIWNQIKDSVQ